MDEFMGFSMLVVIMACMAWIWRKLKDLEILIKNKDSIQQKHNKDVAASLSVIAQEVINQEWERKFKAESEDESP
jgi:Na+-transporting methylmalonyl-CoA/oxaloacetate decarboxylase gamma subunit